MPVHLPMALHPSTQSWRVIWLRLGPAINWATEKACGRATNPSTVNRQFANFSRKRHSILKASLDREISLFAEREQLSEILILPQRIAPAEEASSATDQNVAPCDDHALSPELLAGGGERRNQPVIMERISLTGPARMTSTR